MQTHIHGVILALKYCGASSGDSMLLNQYDFSAFVGQFEPAMSPPSPLPMITASYCILHLCNLSKTRIAIAHNWQLLRMRPAALATNLLR